MILPVAGPSHSLPSCLRKTPRLVIRRKQHLPRYHKSELDVSCAAAARPHSHGGSGGGRKGNNRRRHPGGDNDPKGQEQHEQILALSLFAIVLVMVISETMLRHTWCPEPEDTPAPAHKAKLDEDDSSTTSNQSCLPPWSAAMQQTFTALNLEHMDVKEGFMRDLKRFAWVMLLV